MCVCVCTLDVYECLGRRNHDLPQLTAKLRAQAADAMLRYLRKDLLPFMDLVAPALDGIADGTMNETCFVAAVVCGYAPSESVADNDPSLRQRYAREM